MLGKRFVGRIPSLIRRISPTELVTRPLRFSALIKGVHLLRGFVDYHSDLRLKLTAGTLLK